MATRERSRTRRIVLASAVVGVILATMLLAVGWLGAQRATHPKVPSDESTLAQYPLPVQDVAFTSRDGTRLAGWWVPGNGAAPATVVLLSRYGATRNGMLPHAQYLHDAG